MNYQPPAAHQPDEKPIVGRDAHDTIESTGRWSGPTYYGRSQLKPAPFNNWVVGGYIALAGLSGAAALIGRPAIVLERIANDEGVGCVKIDGEVWTARSYDEHEVIPAGDRVEVVEIRGATALVMH